MILLIDSYDSFTNNLANLVKVNAQQEVITIHNDAFGPEEYEDFVNNYLPKFEYVVIGPGPGHPSIDKDVGIIGWLLRRFRDDRSLVPVPILGICLGFQSLCYEFGNEVSKLSQVKHGQIYKIHPIHCDLYPDVELFEANEEEKNPTNPTFDSVRYHSLFVQDINDQIVPLAYCYEPDTKILMAAKHKNLPFYGVQYHPESICSSQGDLLIRNFTQIATSFNEQFRQESLGLDVKVLENDHAVHEKYLIKDGLLEDTARAIYLNKFNIDVSPTEVCDYLYKKDGESNFILLNSASIPGEWSIIGLYIEDQTEVITHSTDEPSILNVSKYKSSLLINLEENVWNFISQKIKNEYISRESINSQLGQFHQRQLPFFGGYMGLISYEEGQHVLIEKMELLCNGNTPDLKLAFIERFIIHDHVTNDWFVISINKFDDGKWVEEFSEELKLVTKINIEDIPFTVAELSSENDKHLITFDFPSKDKYNEQFAKCQEYLHSGDSYELCLTTQLKITLPKYINAWDIYKVLTLRKNPSPFSCFMEFDDCVLISSSPERFLSWKDDENGNKTVELRPIKGTVKNTPDVSVEDATKILKTPKEMGENLMIVDLIRHDLYQFTEKVEVSQLMAVEEYKTVFQLVSVIKGKLDKVGYHGIDLLHSSLPPGSMTGAPKKRSVQLLQDIESLQTNGNVGGRRGIYSGVVGYWSITDDADWSVIIRSVFRYVEDKTCGDSTNTWGIGAGGAITVLSEAESEWEEMYLKLSSALQAFQ